MATMFGDVTDLQQRHHPQNIPQLVRSKASQCRQNRFEILQHIKNPKGVHDPPPPPPFLVPRCGYDCVYVRGLTFFSFTLLELCWYNYCLKVYLQYVYLIIC